MKSKLLLRIAAAVQLFHAIGHTTGVATWQQQDDAIPNELIRMMQTVQFSFMDKTDSTMAGFYDGFGYCGTILLVFIAVLLWIAADIKDKSITKVLWITGVALVLLAVDEIIYFFPMATAFSLISAALVFVSIGIINKNIAK